VTGFLDLSTSVSLNDLEPSKEGFLINFSQILTAAHILFQQWIATKWPNTDQDNQHK